MKKIFLLVLFLSIIFPNISLWETPNYPIYYWTKKCEIDTEKQTKTYAFFQNEENSIYYLENWNLYKNADFYKTWVDYLLIEFNWNIIYWINNWKKVDIYKNQKKLITVDSFDYWSWNYDKYLDKYSISVYVNWQNYVLVNEKLISNSDFFYHDRYFSENKKYFVDNYYNLTGFKVVKDWKTIIERKDSYIRDFVASNDGKKFSASVQDKWLDYNIFVKNWKITDLKNIYFYQYSPSWKDLYYAEKYGENNIFYKNDEKLFEIKWQVSNSFKFNFLDENNFYTILTNRDDYAFIENWKVRISYDDKLQIKTIIKKSNWDIFIVKRDKNIWKDILEINWKKIIEAKRIDERYLNDWIDTFSLYPNRLNSDEYYTYLTTDDNYYFYVNGFVIDNFYDYLNLENGLNNFTFGSNYWKIRCKDIKYLYPDISYTRKELENFILKLKSFSSEKKVILKIKLENILKKQSLEKNKEILKMFLDNLD